MVREEVEIVAGIEFTRRMPGQQTTYPDMVYEEEWCDNDDDTIYLEGDEMFVE